MLLNIFCLAPKKLTTVNIKTDNVFNAIHDRNSLQQAQITELMETTFSVSTVQMKDQQQSFRPLQGQ